MRSFLINKNLSLYYWLKKRIGKRGAFWVANTFEKLILIFGREQVGSRTWWHMNFTGVMKQRKNPFYRDTPRKKKKSRENNRGIYPELGMEGNRRQYRCQ